MIASSFAWVFVGTILLYKCNERGFDWVWIHRMSLTAAFLATFFALRVRLRAGVVAAVMFLYFSLHTLAFSGMQFHRELSPKLQTALRLAASQGGMLVLLIPMFILTSGRRLLGVRPFFKESLALPLALSAWAVAIGALFTAHRPSGVAFLINPSIAGTLIALYLVGSRCWVAWALCPVSLLLLGASTPVLVLLAGLMARLTLGKAGAWSRAVYGLVAGLFVTLVAVLVKFSALDMASGNGRFGAWLLAIDHMKGLEWAFGHGLGSTGVLIPLAQVDAGYTLNGSEFFMYLHNDWLQILFETGAVGLLLSVAVWVRAVWLSRYDARWAAMVVAYGVAMLTNFPLHSPLLLISGITLIGGAYLEE